MCLYVQTWTRIYIYICIYVCKAARGKTIYVYICVHTFWNIHAFQWAFKLFPGRGPEMGPASGKSMYIQCIYIYIYIYIYFKHTRIPYILKQPPGRGPEMDPTSGKSMYIYIYIYIYIHIFKTYTLSYILNLPPGRGPEMGRQWKNADVSYSLRILEQACRPFWVEFEAASGVKSVIQNIIKCSKCRLWVEFEAASGVHGAINEPSNHRSMYACIYIYTYIHVTS